MIWQPITQSFDKIIEILSDGIMKGDTQIEQMRCVFHTDDSNIVHNLSAFDFVDLDPSKDTIKKITLYQLIDKNQLVDFFLKFCYNIYVRNGRGDEDAGS